MDERKWKEVQIGVLLLGYGHKFLESYIAFAQGKELVHEFYKDLLCLQPICESLPFALLCSVISLLPRGVTS